MKFAYWLEQIFILNGTLVAESSIKLRSGCEPGAYFNYNFSLTVQIWLKFCFAIIQFLWSSDHNQILHMCKIL